MRAELGGGILVHRKVKLDGPLTEHEWLENTFRGIWLLET
jgi:hypothetical protein